MRTVVISLRNELSTEMKSRHNGKTQLTNYQEFPAFLSLHAQYTRVLVQHLTYRSLFVWACALKTLKMSDPEDDFMCDDEEYDLVKRFLSFIIEFI